MTDLIMVVPTRGRPHAAAELAQSFAETCTAGTRLVLVVDESDPELDAYHDSLRSISTGRVTYITPVPNAAGTMVGALNEAAAFAAQQDWFAIGFMGDDHRPRTRGWDAAYLEALRELGSGIVYGNDLLQRGALPTQCAMTADIVRALGWMAPPMLRHLYVDNFWLDLGRIADCITYLPDVTVEHMHPVAGKAAMDDGYIRVNSAAVYNADEAAYRRFSFDGGLEAAAAAVSALRTVRP